MSKTTYYNYAEQVHPTDMIDPDKVRDYFIEIRAYQIAKEFVEKSDGLRAEIRLALTRDGCPPASGELEEVITKIANAIEDWEERATASEDMPIP